MIKQPEAPSFSKLDRNKIFNLFQIINFKTFRSCLAAMESADVAQAALAEAVARGELRFLHISRYIDLEKKKYIISRINYCFVF